MMSCAVTLLAIFMVVATTVYVVKDIISTKKIQSAEMKIDICSAQIKDFNENVTAIQSRLSSIEHRLSNIENNTLIKREILHD